MYIICTTISGISIYIWYIWYYLYIYIYMYTPVVDCKISMGPRL